MSFSSLGLTGRPQRGVACAWGRQRPGTRALVRSGSDAAPGTGLWQFGAPAAKPSFGELARSCNVPLWAGLGLDAGSAGSLADQAACSAERHALARVALCTAAVWSVPRRLISVARPAVRCRLGRGLRRLWRDERCIHGRVRPCGGRVHGRLRRRLWRARGHGRLWRARGHWRLWRARGHWRLWCARGHGRLWCARGHGRLWCARGHGRLRRAGCGWGVRRGGVRRGRAGRGGAAAAGRRGRAASRAGQEVAQPGSRPPPLPPLPPPLLVSEN